MYLQWRNNLDIYIYLYILCSESGLHMKNSEEQALQVTQLWEFTADKADTLQLKFVQAASTFYTEDIVIKKR